MSGQISIRGFSNESINLGIDDISTHQYSNGTSSTSRITALTVEPSLVDSIIINKGGECVEFVSGSVGGSITVKTKDAKDYLNTWRDYKPFLRQRQSWQTLWPESL